MESSPIEARLPESDGDDRIVCPRCCRQTDGLLNWEITNALFLLVYIVWGSYRVTACGQCMRRELLKRLALAVPMTNLLFPIFGTVYLFQWLCTFGPGHSDEASARAHTLSREEHLERMQGTINLQRNSRKELVILAIIVLLCGSLWAVGFLLKSRDPQPEPLKIVRPPWGPVELD